MFFTILLKSWDTTLNTEKLLSKTSSSFFLARFPGIPARVPGIPARIFLKSTRGCFSLFCCRTKNLAWIGNLARGLKFLPRTGKGWFSSSGRNSGPLEFVGIHLQSTKVCSRSTKVYFPSTKVYSRSTQVYFHSTKVYSGSTKVYFQSTQVYSRSTKVYFQGTKVDFQITQSIFTSAPIYFKSAQIHLQSTKVYSRSTKYTFKLHKVYFQSTQIYYNILSKYKSILWKYKRILSKHTNVLSKYKSILSKYKGILSKNKGILSKYKSILSKYKYTFKLHKYTFKEQKFTLEVQKYTVEKKPKNKVVESAIWFNWFTCTVWGLCWYHYFWIYVHFNKHGHHVTGIWYTSKKWPPIDLYAALDLTERSSLLIQRASWPSVEAYEGSRCYWNLYTSRWICKQRILHDMWCEVGTRLSTRFGNIFL